MQLQRSANNNNEYKFLISVCVVRTLGNKIITRYMLNTSRRRGSGVVL